MSPNSDLASWLEAIGLSKHLELFRQHSLDLDIVLDLTEEDLLTLGLPLGDRKRFLRESAALDTRRPIQSRGSAHESQGNAPERRRLTILYCDLVDSTVLASRLDPEEFGPIMGRYLRIVEGIVQRNGGYIDRLVGDGMLVCFGWPVANEDQVERGNRPSCGGIRGRCRLSELPGRDRDRGCGRRRDLRWKKALGDRRRVNPESCRATSIGRSAAIRARRCRNMPRPEGELRIGRAAGAEPEGFPGASPRLAHPGAAPSPKPLFCT
jgi:class 3 adenylate cyclase